MGHKLSIRSKISPNKNTMITVYFVHWNVKKIEEMCTQVTGHWRITSAVCYCVWQQKKMEVKLLKRLCYSSWHANHANSSCRCSDKLASETQCVSISLHLTHQGFCTTHVSSLANPKNFGTKQTKAIYRHGRKLL